jgi:excisionase family DNA binding protein
MLEPTTAAREPLLSAKDAAAYLNISLGTLKRWVALKEIEVVRSGKNILRFRRSALDRWIARHTEPAERDR